MDPRKQLGLNVARLRHLADMTQEELCEAAEIDRSYLQRIETGRMNPSFQVLYKIGKALHASWNELLFQIDLHPRPQSLREDSPTSRRRKR
ncbi:MAG: helix-turn-helix transcriptional regulator [Verrucomicrobium sp.]|nr:helix-turn-helix transcriptional regulator [Verrucomicrobium sp.]